MKSAIRELLALLAVTALLGAGVFMITPATGQSASADASLSIYTGGSLETADYGTSDGAVAGEPIVVSLDTLTVNGNRVTDMDRVDFNIRIIDSDTENVRTPPSPDGFEIESLAQAATAVTISEPGNYTIRVDGDIDGIDYSDETQLTVYQDYVSRLDGVDTGPIDPFPTEDLIDINYDSASQPAVGMPPLPETITQIGSNSTFQYCEPLDNPEPADSNIAKFRTLDGPELLTLFAGTPVESYDRFIPELTELALRMETRQRVYDEITSRIEQTEVAPTTGGKTEIAGALTDMWVPSDSGFVEDADDVTSIGSFIQFGPGNRVSGGCNGYTVSDDVIEQRSFEVEESGGFPGPMTNEIMYVTLSSQQIPVGSALPPQDKIAEYNEVVLTDVYDTKFRPITAPTPPERVQNRTNLNAWADVVELTPTPTINHANNTSTELLLSNATDEVTFHLISNAAPETSGVTNITDPRGEREISEDGDDGYTYSGRVQYRTKTDTDRLELSYTPTKENASVGDTKLKEPPVKTEVTVDISDKPDTIGVAQVYRYDYTINDQKREEKCTEKNNGSCGEWEWGDWETTDSVAEQESVPITGNQYNLSYTNVSNNIDIEWRELPQSDRAVVRIDADENIAGIETQANQLFTGTYRYLTMRDTSYDLVEGPSQVRPNPYQPLNIHGVPGNAQIDYVGPSDLLAQVNALPSPRTVREYEGVDAEDLTSYRNVTDIRVSGETIENVDIELPDGPQQSPTFITSSNKTPSEYIQPETIEIEGPNRLFQADSGEPLTLTLYDLAGGSVPISADYAGQTYETLLDVSVNNSRDLIEVGVFRAQRVGTTESGEPKYERGLALPTDGRDGFIRLNVTYQNGNEQTLTTNTTFIDETAKIYNQSATVTSVSAEYVPDLSWDQQNVYRPSTAAVSGVASRGFNIQFGPVLTVLIIVGVFAGLYIAIKKVTPNTFLPDSLFGR